MVKATNAQAAGASAVVIFNEGQPGRTEAIAGNLGTPVGIPALGATYQLGVEMLQSGSVTWHIAASTVSENRTTYNVVADSPCGAIPAVPSWSARTTIPSRQALASTMTAPGWR